MSLPRIAGGAIAGLLCVLASCGRERGDNGRKPDDAPIPVTIAEVDERPWNDIVDALGTVKARESVTVTAKVSETVQRVHFESGDAVAAGAPLVTLSGQQRVSLIAAVATADEAEHLRER